MIHYPEADTVAAALREAAEVAVMPRFRSLQAHEVMEKGQGDIVTAADIEAEQMLELFLSSLMPGSLVVGEEAVSRDETVLESFETEDPVWLIDPVDGTRNFSEGREAFCMMVALIVKGEAVMGWIHRPTEGVTAVAEHGNGAISLTAMGDETRISIPDAPPLERMTGQINSLIFPSPGKERVRREAPRHFGKIDSLRSAGCDFHDQARGLRHFALYRRLWSWDHGPGVLLLREAGGVADRIDDEPYRATDRVSGLLTAPDPESWHHIRELLVRLGTT